MPEVDSQQVKAGDIKKAFESAAQGLNLATELKVTEYTLRAMKGESVDELTKGLPPIWRTEINNRLNSVVMLGDQDETWKVIQERVKSYSQSFDPKAFEYGWRIVHGEDKHQILQGIPAKLQSRVETYINEIFKLGVEKSENLKQG
jgi:hypothetical protein